MAKTMTKERKKKATVKTEAVEQNASKQSAPVVAKEETAKKVVETKEETAKKVVDKGQPVVAVKVDEEAVESEEKEIVAAVPVEEETEEKQPEKKETEEAAEETPAPVVEEEKEETPAQPVEKAVEKKPERKLDATPVRDFTAYLLPKANYSEDAALELLRKKLRDYKEIHADFLAAMDKKSALKIKKEYIPVYYGKGIAEFAWTVKDKVSETAHTETKEVSICRHHAPTFFRVDSIPADVKTTKLDAAKGADELYPCKTVSFSACEKALKKEAKSFSPKGSAQLTFYNLAYEICYVPVLRVVCTFEGEEYVSCVNMLNGECDVQYRVSDRLRDKADKTLRGVITARRAILATILYALTFVGLGWYSAVKGGTTDYWSLLLIGMSCAVAVPLASYIFCFTYKRKKMLLKTVRTGKMPRAAVPVVLAIVSAIVAVAELLAFVLYLM